MKDLSPRASDLVLMLKFQILHFKTEILPPLVRTLSALKGRGVGTAHSGWGTYEGPGALRKGPWGRAPLPPHPQTGVLRAAKAQASLSCVSYRRCQSFKAPRERSSSEQCVKQAGCGNEACNRSTLGDPEILSPGLRASQSHNLGVPPCWSCTPQGPF